MESAKAEMTLFVFNLLNIKYSCNKFFLSIMFILSVRHGFIIVHELVTVSSNLVLFIELSDLDILSFNNKKLKFMSENDNYNDN